MHVSVPFFDIQIVPRSAAAARCQIAGTSKNPKTYCFFFIDFCPKIEFRNVHVMEYLGEFHKSTRRGDFVKIFENVHKMEHFR